MIGGALLTQTIGSLLYTLGLVAGQVGGALVMDSLWPTPGVLVGWQTVTGGALTVLAPCAAHRLTRLVVDRDTDCFPGPASRPAARARDLREDAAAPIEWEAPC